jgi:hypothetical protein
MKTSHHEEILPFIVLAPVALAALRILIADLIRKGDTQ